MEHAPFKQAEPIADETVYTREFVPLLRKHLVHGYYYRFATPPPCQPRRECRVIRGRVNNLSLPGLANRFPRRECREEVATAPPRRLHANDLNALERFPRRGSWQLQRDDLHRVAQLDKSLGQVAKQGFHTPHMWVKVLQHKDNAVLRQGVIQCGQ